MRYASTQVELLDIPIWQFTNTLPAGVGVISYLILKRELTPFSQGLVYELGDLWKMQRNVLLGHIQQFQPLVLDVEGRVISLFLVGG